MLPAPLEVPSTIAERAHVGEYDDANPFAAPVYFIPFARTVAPELAWRKMFISDSVPSEIEKFAVFPMLIEDTPTFRRSAATPPFEVQIANSEASFDAVGCVETR